jgi:FMN-dependent NADH-azoreductase
MHVLHIDTSPAADSATRQLTETFVARLRGLQPGVEVTHLDLAAEPPPLIDAAWIAADTTDPAERSPEMRAAIAPSDAYIAQVFAADTFVLGLPMHNFTVPAAFKLWIDHIVRHGETFEFGPDGVTGHLAGRRALVATARGGFYAETDPGSDFQEPYVRKVLGFLGIGDVAFVHAEGLALSERPMPEILQDFEAPLGRIARDWAAVAPADRATEPTEA